MKARAAVILIKNNEIALIERYRSGKHYFVFPGGKIELGESPEAAAIREIKEELGLVVKIRRMVAEVWYLGSPQYYFLADIIGGEFGHGKGSEMFSRADSEKGSHVPTWISWDVFSKLPVLPKIMAKFVLNSNQTVWPDHPLVVNDIQPDELAGHAN